jgi:integrase
MISTAYKNELIKRRFYDYLKNSSTGFSDATIECFDGAILLWEDFSEKADFARFNRTAARSFKDWIKAKKKKSFQENVSLSYCYDNLRHLKFFFGWLSRERGYKTMDQTAIDYLNLSKADARIARQPKSVKFPTLEQVKSVIESIKGGSEIEMRDKALISLMYLTGARISAAMTLSMRCFDREKLIVYQDPKLGVKTKFSKSFVSSLIPFSYKEPLQYLVSWFDYLEKQKGFQPTDPIFPATKIDNGKENLSYFNTGKVEPIFWKSSSSPRKIFEKRFFQAGVPYYHPHTLRHLLVQEISKLPLTEEQKKAISQGFGHENAGTTFGSYGYGKIDDNRQVEIIRKIDFGGQQKEVPYLLVGKEDLKQFLAETAKKADDPAA